MRCGYYGRIAVCLLSVAWMAGCGEPKQSTEGKTDVTAKDIQEETQDVLEATRAFTLQQKKEYQKQIESKLNAYEKKIEQMVSDVETVKQGAEYELDQKIEDLQEKKDDVDKRLAELKSATEETWEDIKVGIDRAMEDLETAYERALSRKK